jgi:hypothetical protein
LVGEATVDCYNEYEQATGLFTMIEEHLAIPFQTEVLGVAAIACARSSKSSRQRTGASWRGLLA